MNAADPVFLTTQWTQVLAARGDSTQAGEALRALCAAYYEPVVRFLRQGRREEDAAREEAHAFFEWVLSRDAFAAADREKGRFRSYLLGALKHFLANRHARGLRLKRGGGHEPVPLTADSVETAPGLVLPDEHSLPPDREFDRQWALHVLRRALEALEKSAAAAGEDAEHFTFLKPFLVGEGERGGLAAFAQEHGLGEATLRSQLHRLRQRFRACVRREISPTLASLGEVHDEMESLLAALAWKG